MKFKFSPQLQYNVIGGKFKFQAEDSFLEYFFWRFEKHISLSEKKPPLVTSILKRSYLHSVSDDTFKSIFTYVFDGRVLNIEYFYSQRVEQVPVDFLHVAVVNGESVNEGPDLSEANGQGGNVLETQ